MILQHLDGNIPLVSQSVPAYSSRRVLGCCAALLVLLALVESVGGRSVPDGASYRAGYSAVSDPRSARTLMARPGVTVTGLCDTLLERTVVAHGSDLIVSHDFLTGCKRAVGDAME